MYRMLISAGAAALAIAPAHAASFSVDARASIFQYAGSSDDGTAPLVIALSGLGATAFTFSATASHATGGGSAPGITYNGGTYNDADGVGAAGTINSTGYGAFSGIASSVPNIAGFLTGVFTTATPTGAAPATRTYGAADYAAAAATPLLNQLFFIGDGLTGDGAGATQSFAVPTGATFLVLGFADGCGYGGGPNCYGDNSGTISGSYTAVGAVVPAAIPEPASWAMMVGGFGALGLRLRSRRSPALA